MTGLADATASGGAPTAAARSRFPTGRTTSSFYASKAEFISENAHDDATEIVQLSFMLDSLRMGLPKNLLTDRRSGVFYSIGLYYLNLGRIASENTDASRRVFGPAYFPSTRSRALNDDRLVHRGCIYAMIDDVLGITFGEPIFTSQLQVDFRKPVLENTCYMVEGVGAVVGRSRTGALKVEIRGSLCDALSGETLVSAEGLFIQTAAMGKMYRRALELHKRGRRRDTDGEGEDDEDAALADAGDEHSQDEYQRALERRINREKLMAPLRVADDERSFLFNTPFYRAAEDAWAANDPFVRSLNRDRRSSGLRGCKARRKRGHVVDPVDGKAFLRVFADERLLCAPVYFLITSEGHANIAHGGAIGACCVEACRRAYGGFHRGSSAASRFRWRIDSLFLRYRGQVPLNTTLRMTLEAAPAEDAVRDDRVVRTYRGALDSGDGASDEQDVVLYDEFVIVLSCALEDVANVTRL